MCFWQRSPDPTPQPSPPPIMRRNPDLTRVSQLPTKKKVADEDEVTGVEYGSTAKKGGAAAGKKVGTAALRIPLNTGQATASEGQGGLNV